LYKLLKIIKKNNYNFVFDELLPYFNPKYINQKLLKYPILTIINHSPNSNNPSKNPKREKFTIPIANYINFLLRIPVDLVFL